MIICHVNAAWQGGETNIIQNNMQSKHTLNPSLEPALCSIFALRGFSGILLDSTRF